MFHSVLLCHLPNSQVCKYPHKLEDCQHLDELFWHQSSLVEKEEKSQCWKCWDPGFITQESSGGMGGGRSDTFRLVLWVGLPVAFREQNTEGR